MKEFGKSIELVSRWWRFVYNDCVSHSNGVGETPATAGETPALVMM